MTKTKKQASEILNGILANHERHVTPREALDMAIEALDRGGLFMSEEHAAEIDSVAARVLRLEADRVSGKFRIGPDADALRLATACKDAGLVQP